MVGGRRSLMSDVDYTVQPAADGSGNVVLLRNADAVIAPLATLARVGQAAQPPAAPAEANAVAPEQPQATAPNRPTRAAGHSSAGTARGERRPAELRLFESAHSRGNGSVLRRRPLRARSQYGEPNTCGRWLELRPNSRRCFVALAIAFSPIAIAARTGSASATPMSGGCARSATSWKGAGARPGSVLELWPASNGRRNEGMRVGTCAVAHAGARFERRRSPRGKAAAETELQPAATRRNRTNGISGSANGKSTRTEPRTIIAHSVIEKRYSGCAIRENWMPVGKELTGGGGSLSLYDTTAETVAADVGGFQRHASRPRRWPRQRCDDDHRQLAEFHRAQSGRAGANALSQAAER